MATAKRRTKRCPRCNGVLSEHRYGWGHLYSIGDTIALNRFCDYSEPKAKRFMS